MSDPNTPGKEIGFTFEQTQRGKPKLIDTDGHSYYKHHASKDKKTEFYVCTLKRCSGRLVFNRTINQAKLIQEHLEEGCIDPLERERYAAIERIRSLTLSSKEGVKALSLVRSVFKELPRDILAVMPSEESLYRRVKRWARANNIPLIKTRPEDFDVDGADEILEVKNAASALGTSSDRRKKRRRTQPHNIPTLKRVDEHGNEIGAATLEEFLSGPTEWNEDGSSSELQHDERQHVQEAEASANFTVDDDGSMDDGGDDFQMDFERVEDDEPVPVELPTVFESKAPHVVTTSSNSSPIKLRSSNKLSPIDAAKSGERCFVCGDELIVSETLASSEETFRKACCYLNVKSEGTWFPRTENSKFYSFCESCTNEILRIHSLYRKVEEMQSLIFKKVESVEKRIADAEIVDNWMADAPHSTALRFEGFRKQVMINYRNKLKLRREVRFGKKTGSPLLEVQPCSSAHMFAKDPSETKAFSKLVADNVTHGSIVDHEPENPPDQVARRTRGRPNLKKAVEEREDIQPQHSYTPEMDPITFDDSSMPQDFGDNGFENELDDSQDAISETFENEIKFWENDPSKLDVQSSERIENADAEAEDGNEEYHDDNDDDFEEEMFESDDDSEDADWGSERKKKRRRTATPAKTHKVSTRKGHERSSNQSEKNEEGDKSKAKGGISARCNDFKFPDAVLNKDGRLFMGGVEIIKNPPGAYKRRPYSVSYTCGACGKIVVGFWYIRLHISGHHLGLYKCHICQKEFTSPLYVDRHITMTHDTPKLEECPICGKMLRNHPLDKSMKRHRWLHLGEEERKDPQYKSWYPQRFADLNEPKKTPTQTFMCGQCGKTFQMPGALKRHEQLHTNPTTLICQYCGKTFTRRTRLNDHAARCGSGKKGQQKNSLISFPCLKCPSRFNSKATRWKHMKKFHATQKELPFSCPKCRRRFSTDSGLRHHKRVCIEGLKGFNNKREQQASTSVAGSSDFKPDVAESTSTSMNHNESNPQYDSSSAAAALGFSYGFLGGGSNFGESQYDHRQ